jgi:hypothetical protein
LDSNFIGGSILLIAAVAVVVFLIRRYPNDGDD